VSVAPLLHQRLEFGVVPVRKHDAGGDEQVAGAAARLRNPLPFKRKVRPLEVFLGIDNSTALPSVGTRTLPPSTASYSVIGRSMRRSLPSTLKNGCGAILTVIRRSPGRWPGAVSPCPFSRIC